jgi:voltage-gated potassium channel
MFRTKLSLALDPEMRKNPGLSKTNIVLVYLICLSILLGVLETEGQLTDKFEEFFQISHVVLLTIFGAEYAARMWAAPVNPRYKNTLKYAITFASLVDLLVLVSLLLPAFGLETALLRMFRAARLVRLARLGRYSLAMQMIGSAISQRRYELGVSVIGAFGLMLLSSSALYFAERHIQPEDFGSIPRAMWWSVATLTTVGYGDIVPLTVLGRVAAAITALTGIGLIALPTGILAGAFSEALQNIRCHIPDGSMAVS